MTDLHPHLRLAVGMHEIDDALPGGGPARRSRCRRSPGAMRASELTVQVISVITSAAPPRPRAV
jgi:hypothetical protein